MKSDNEASDGIENSDGNASPIFFSDMILPYAVMTAASVFSLLLFHEGSKSKSSPSVHSFSSQEAPFI